MEIYKVSYITNEDGTPDWNGSAFIGAEDEAHAIEQGQRILDAAGWQVNGTLQAAVADIDGEDSTLYLFASLGGTTWETPEEVDDFVARTTAIGGIVDDRPDKFRV